MFSGGCGLFRVWVFFFLQMISGFRDFEAYVSQCGFGVGFFSVMERVLA